jgi:hypothetical protein
MSWDWPSPSVRLTRHGRGDGFRESGFSKERRLEPQITISLLAGADGFPLMVSAFEGKKAETKTMLPVIEAFMRAYQLPDVTVRRGRGDGVGGEPDGDRGRRECGRLSTRNG